MNVAAVVAPARHQCTPKAARRSGSAVVLGGASNVLEEAERALRARERATIVAVNWAARLMDCEIMCTTHLEKIPPILADIAKHGRARPEIHSVMPTPDSRVELPGVDHMWGPGTFRGGNSGLFTAGVCHLLGFEEILLCGCPMDGTGSHFDGDYLDHWYNTPRRVSNTMLGWQTAWRRMAPELGGKVRSMTPGSYAARLFGEAEL